MSIVRGSTVRFFNSDWPISHRAALCNNLDEFLGKTTVGYFTTVIMDSSFHLPRLAGRELDRGLGI